MNLVAGFSVCLFEGYLYYRVWKHFLPWRKGGGSYAAVVVAAAEFLVFVLNGIGIPVLNLLAAVTVHLAVCSALFGGGLGKRVYLTIFIWFILSFMEFFVLLVLNMALGQRTIAVTYGIQEFLFTAFLAKGAAFGVLEAVCRSLPPMLEEAERRILAVFILFPIASILLFAGLAVLDIQLAGEAGSRIFLTFGCLLIFVLNLLLLKMYSKAAGIANQLKIYEQLNTKSALLNERYTRAEELRQQLHNVGNRMKTIHILAQQNQTDKIMEITSQWAQTVERLTSDRYCGSEILNAVLNEKKMEAQENGVEMKIYAEPGFSMEKIRVEDMIGILGNLLDNAIEAAAQRAGDGWVTAELFRANSGRLIMLKIENNFLHAPRQENDSFITLKEDKAHHGFGTKYVRDVVERYGGWCRFSVTEESFQVIVMLPE